MGSSQYKKKIYSREKVYRDNPLSVSVSLCF